MQYNPTTFPYAGQEDIEFRRITNFPNNWITNTGEVWSFLPKGHGLGEPVWRKLKIYRKLYQKTKRLNNMALRINYKGIEKNFNVHQLVLNAFVGPCPEGMECRHLDGDPSNNHLSNLKWGTHQENMEDRKLHWITEKFNGTKTPYKTAALIFKIWKENKIGATNIIKFLDCTRSRVAEVIYGRKWKGFREEVDLTLVEIPKKFMKYIKEIKKNREYKMP